MRHLFQKVGETPATAFRIPPLTKQPVWTWFLLLCIREHMFLMAQTSVEYCRAETWNLKSNVWRTT